MKNGGDLGIKLQEQSEKVRIYGILSLQYKLTVHVAP